MVLETQYAIYAAVSCEAHSTSAPQARKILDTGHHFDCKIHCTSTGIYGQRTVPVITHMAAFYTDRQIEVVRLTDRRFAPNQRRIGCIDLAMGASRYALRAKALRASFGEGLMLIRRKRSLLQCGGGAPWPAQRRMEKDKSVLLYRSTSK